MTLTAMSAQPSIPSRIILLDVVLVLIWLPLIYGARLMIERVIAANPSPDLLEATYLSVIGTLVIVTSAYVFGLVLLNKFMTQNFDGAQPRITRPLVIGALALYAVVGAIVFTTI